MVNIQIEFDELLKAIDQLSDEQKHILSMRLANEPKLVGKPKKPRVLGLHPGAFQPSDDFDDPLFDDNAAEKTESQLKPRTPNLGYGSVWMSDDFDDPLPDEFWLGEDA